MPFPTHAQIKQEYYCLFWMFAIQEMNIESIDHIFLVSGLSFMSCDEDFGVDEREKARTSVHTVRVDRNC